MDSKSHNGKGWGKTVRQSPLNAKVGSFSVITLLLAACFPVADAVGLGPAQIHSALGQPLHLDVPILGLQADQELDPQCAKAYVESLEGARIATGRVQLIGSVEQPAMRVRTHQVVNEPAVNVSVALGCDLPIRRDYQILLDFPPDRPIEQPFLPYAARDEKPVKRARNTASASGVTADFAVASSSRRTSARTSVSSLSGDSSAARGSGLTSERKHAQSDDKKLAPHSVLRLSTITTGSGIGVDLPMNLRLSDTLTLPKEGLPSPTQAQPSAEQNHAASAASASVSEDLGISQAKPNSSASGQASKPMVEKEEILNDSELTKTSFLQFFETVDDRALALGATAILSLIAIAGLLWWKPGSSNSKSSKSREPEWWKEKEPQHHNDQQNEGIENTGTTESMAIDAEHESSVLNVETVELKPLPQEERVVADTAFNDSDLDATRNHSAAEEVEEVSDLSELAEAWFALNRPDAVIEILEPMNTEEPPKSPQPWLYLMNAYWLTGDQKNYDDLCERIRNAFNVNVPDWSARSQSNGDDFKSLTDFPHIKDRIVKLWNSEEIVPYLESLLLDDRGGTRAGFPLIVYQNILRLIRLAKDPDREKLAEEDKLPEKLSEIMTQSTGLGTGEFDSRR